MRLSKFCGSLTMIRIWLLSIWCVLYAPESVRCWPNSAHTTKANLLRSSSGFKIHAKINVWTDSLYVAGRVMLTETYSVANERSVVELSMYNDTSGHKEQRKYYVNGTDNQVIMVESQKCETEDRNGMLTDILSYMEPEPRRRLIEKWIRPIEGVPDYVLGAGRILQYIDQNRDKMNKTVEQNVRDRQNDRYSMDSPFGDDVNMTVILAQSAFIIWNGAELPLRVWFQFGRIEFIMIDFFLVEPLTSHTPLEDAEYYLDPTTVELGLKCVAPTKQDLVMPFREVFSMTADVIDPLDDSIPIRRMFLAYDGKQTAFRRDVLDEDGSPSTTTIYDFKRQLKFNIKHPRQQLSVDEKKSKSTELGDAIKAKAATVNCVAAVCTGERATLFTIPYSDLVHMGSGMVRGIEVDIYEEYNFQRPHLFFPPASYTNRSTGEWQLQAETLNAMTSKFGQHYSAIYYFARATLDSTGESRISPTERDSTVRAKNSGKLLYAQFGQLIRVDLMLGGRLLKVVNVYDFVWQLADAPNADRQETLFLVPSVCFKDAATSSGVSKMSQQLTMKTQLSFVGATRKDITEQDAMILLDSPSFRYKALARALSAHMSLELSSSRFLELSSSLTKFGEQPFQVHTSLKLSIAEGDAWHANWAGTYVQLWTRREPVLGPTNFDECFFEAVRRRRAGELLFAFILERCYIDVAPIYEVRNNEQGVKVIEFTYSSVFRINRQVPSPHLAMRVELVPSKGRTRPSEFQENIYEGLMDRHLILPIVDTLHSKWLGESIILKVSKLEFASRRDDEPYVGAEDSPSKLGLNGLVLTMGLEVESSSDGEDMSYEICRAACLMDLACRSYSVCTRGLSITCRTSELDLSDPNLISELEPKLREARAAKNMGEFQVSFEYQPQALIELEPEDLNDKNDEQVEQEPPTGKQQVSLGLDKRCRVYKKRALDMFSELPRSVGQLNSKVILEVDNEEECAKRCLDNNVQFFLQAPNAGLLATTKDQESDEILKQNKKRMAKWCAMFKYLNLKTSSDGKKLLAQLPEQKKDAICVMSKARGGLMKVRAGDKEARVKAEMDTFEFEYVNLYEPIHNFQMSFKEETILQASAAGTPRRKMAEMGSPEECARACFTQTIGLEPHCKSFEFVKLTTGAGPTSEQMGEGSVRVTTFCAFNSMSLHDAFEANVYDEVVSLSNDPQAAVTFYEPRKAYMMSDSVLKRLIGSVPNQQTNRSKSGGFGMFLVLILALASGVALGVQVKQPLVEYLAQSQNNEDLIVRRRFSNSVELGAQDGENL